MSKLQDKFEQYGLPLADKLQNNHYLSAITDGFSMILPIVMMGAIFTLLSSLQIGPYQALVAAIGLKTIFGYAAAYTTDMLALFVVYAIAFQLTKKLGFEKDSAFVGPIAIVMFLLLIPMGVSGATKGGEVVEIGGALSTGYLGSKGVFSAILLGLAVPMLYLFFIRKNIVIKMPDSVPPTVAKSFSALVPGFALLLVFSLVRFAFSMTSFGDFNSFLYSLLEKPLSAVTSSPISFVILIVACQLLWFLGIHGYMVVRPVLQMVYLPLAVENLSAYAAGGPMPHIICYYNWATFVAVGGCGGVVGLAILMSFFAKSQRYKTLGKLSLPSVLCNINEPIIFGASIVLNPIFFIPFIFVPLLTFILTYILQLSGIIPYLSGVALPLGTPVLLYGWLQGGIPILLTQVVIIIAQTFAWLPFFKVADKQALQEEANND